VRDARQTGLNLLDVVEATSGKKVTALTAALADPEHRAAVIERLGKFGPDAKGALPQLMKLKLDGDMKVREAAAKAIAAITAE
jgi:HEAT repeat protein